jgi:hypothetical protein
MQKIYPTVEPRSVFWTLISDLLFSIETVCPFRTLFTVLTWPLFAVTTTSLLAKVQNTDLGSTVGKLAVNSRAGMSTIIDSVLTSKGNSLPL